MKVELSNFTIECDGVINNIDDIISALENDTAQILNFFELDKLSKKKKVIIFTDREKYKEHMLQFVDDFKEWMCADTYGGNINLLELSVAKKSKEHRNLNLTKFIKCILHEFVHLCQQELNYKLDEITWYWEALATNLSGQDYIKADLFECDFDKLQKDFNNVKNNYSYSFTLCKFMLENYSKDKLLEYVRNSSLLIQDANEIFELAKRFYK